MHEYSYKIGTKIHARLEKYINNIGVLAVNIEFMWQGLETGQR
jgi:hypothetical protein